MPQQKNVRAFAPASVANVSCGFDVLGFAVGRPGDVVTASFDEKPGVHIRGIEGDEGKLPLKAERNTAGVAVLEMLKKMDKKLSDGICLHIRKQMPMGSGMGSSAASSVAAVIAVNKLLDSPFSRKELLPFTVQAEGIASGVPHADNVAASLLGGFILVRSNNPLDVIPLETPSALHCTVIHPNIEIRTEDTRRILQKQVSLNKAVNQWGNLGALVAGLLKKDYDLIGRSMHDEIIEPIRSVLIPGYDEIKKAAMEAGALGCCISGSGPSIFALSTSQKQASTIGQAMEQTVQSIGLESDLYTSKINSQGAYLLKD